MVGFQLIRTSQTAFHCVLRNNNLQWHHICDSTRGRSCRNRAPTHIYSDKTIYTLLNLSLEVLFQHLEGSDSLETYLSSSPAYLSLFELTEEMEDFLTFFLSQIN